MRIIELLERLLRAHLLEGGDGAEAALARERNAVGVFRGGGGGEPEDAAALAEDSGLLDRAFAKQVVLATPTTFWTLLRTVDLMWRQEAVAEHAREIATLGRELHDRLVTLTGHLGKLGKSLDGAVGYYNTYVASMEARVFVTARKMNALGVGERPLPEVTQIETAARRPTDEHITDGAAVA